MHVAIGDAPLAAQAGSAACEASEAGSSNDSSGATSMKPWSAVATTSDSVPARRASKRAESRVDPANCSKASALSEP